jgi:quinol monooxygenase YgiN
MITIIAKFRVKETEIPAFEKLASVVAQATRRERGNLSYQIYQSRKTANEFTFIEEWLNDTAIENHNQSKHFQDFLPEVERLLLAPPQIDQFVRMNAVFRG